MSSPEQGEVPKEIDDRKNDKETNDETEEQWGFSAEFFRWFLHTQLLERDYENKSTSEVVREIIKPLTTDNQCAMTDLYRKHVKAQQSDWVGRATVFVSHAYKYKFAWSIGCILEYDTELAKSEDEDEDVGAQTQFYWFDPVSLNQHHGAEVVGTDVLIQTFGSSIKSIGRVLVLLGPWSKPTNLTRIWCLFEILVAMQVLPPESVKVFFPSSEQEAFFDALIKDWKVVMTALTHIDAAKATAREKKDQEVISAEIQRTVTFAGLNSTVKTGLREWVVKVAEGEILSLESKGHEQEERLLRLKVATALMRWKLGHLDESIREMRVVVDRYNRSGVSARMKAKVCNDFGAVLLDRVANRTDVCASPASNEQTKQAETDLNEAENAFAKCAEHLEQQTDYSTAAALQSNLGNLQLARKDKERAQAHFEKCLIMHQEASKDLESDNEAEIAMAHSNIGSLLWLKGQHEQAMGHYLECLTIRERVLPGSLYLAVVLLNLGKLCIDIDNRPKAIEYLERAIDIRAEVLGGTAPETEAARRELHNARTSKPAMHIGTSNPVVPVVKMEFSEKSMASNPILQMASSQPSSRSKPVMQMAPSRSKPVMQMAPSRSKPVMQMAPSRSKPVMQMAPSRSKPVMQMAPSRSKPVMQMAPSRSKPVMQMAPSRSKPVMQMAPSRSKPVMQMASSQPSSRSKPVMQMAPSQPEPVMLMASSQSIMQLAPSQPEPVMQMVPSRSKPVMQMAPSQPEPVMQMAASEPELVMPTMQMAPSEPEPVMKPEPVLQTAPSEPEPVMQTVQTAPSQQTASSKSKSKLCCL